MRFLKQLIAWVIGLWNRIFHRPAPIQIYRAICLDNDEDLPAKLPTYAVYIIGVQGNEWLAEMICPCGCGDTLFLNLLRDELPNWKWRVGEDAAVTLSPSVWRVVGCKSHFFLREGKIQWCES
jgi:hypothetical protein